MSLLKSWSAECSEEKQEARQAELEAQLENMSKDWTPAEQRACYLNKLRARLIALTMTGQAQQLEEVLESFAADEASMNPAGPPGLTAEVRDRCGRTLLHVAAWKGHAAVVEMLLTRWKIKQTPNSAVDNDLLQQVFRVDVNARFGPWNGCSGWTALGLAAFMGHADVVEILRRHGANPLLGTSFHKDAFALADALPAKQKAANRNLGSSMLEYLDCGPFGSGKYLADRRPIPVKKTGSAQKQLAQGWQLPRKRLELQAAQNLDAVLNAPDTKENAPQVSKGSLLQCSSEDAVVFQSVASYTEVGRMHLNDIVSVEGPPEECDGYIMVPIKVPTRLLGAETRRLKRCYVELACFEVYETQDVVAKAQRRLPDESCFYRLKLEGEYRPRETEESAGQ